MCWFLNINFFYKCPLCWWDKSRNVDVFSFLFPPSDGDQRRYMSVSEWSRRPGEIYQLLANYLQSARADKKEKSPNIHKICMYHDRQVKLHQFLTFFLHWEKILARNFTCFITKCRSTKITFKGLSEIWYLWRQIFRNIIWFLIGEFKLQRHILIA